MLQRYCLLFFFAMLLFSVQTSIKAAVVVLQHPVLLKAETIAHLRQVHASEDSKWQLVVFGFTHCKDFCPVSLANLALLVKAAANEQIMLEGIFITVDPDRDSDLILANYTKSFGSNINYLRFEGESLERLKAAFGVEVTYYTKNAGNQLNYQVDHSTSAFLIDPEGKIRIIFDAVNDAESISKMFHEEKDMFKP